MQSTQIRQLFFDFFQKHGHTKVQSSSLIPAHDPTLLFANAGMNQFKDLFLGNEKRNYTKAVTIQKCMRAGGKHNDLDNVGFTSRHLTFFEMMGNFSFGDYFKKDAIICAWEFLTTDLKLNPESLHASVFHQDEESYALWRDVIGIPEHRIHRLGAEDNFWQMGDTGPCGPCSEIYVDRGNATGCKKASCNPACGCDRFLEIWNLVFMQYDRQPDGTDIPLKQTGVDTGMGLERLCMIMQKVDSVFAIDLFKPIIQRIEELTHTIYADQDAQYKAAFHVLCDHIRSASLLIADGCAPSNEGRGYVLRKIIRRAALFAQKLTNKNIFPDLSHAVIASLGSIYPELPTHQQLIHTILDSEIKKFAENLVRGQAILQRYLQESASSKTITGAQAFKLYDTFGFPTELIIIMAQEHGFSVDMQAFEQEMHKQQVQSGKKTADTRMQITFTTPLTTTFTGYSELETSSTIIGLVEDNKAVQSVAAGTHCWIIAQLSPFFIVGGGQVPDQGWLTIQEHCVPLQEVRFIDTAIAVLITTPVPLTIGDQVLSTVDRQWREAVMKNHTATHMLQATLIQLFGKQIKQSGSLVHPEYLRFDFTYHQNLTPDEIQRVEDLVNEKIRANIPVAVDYTTMKNALERGALAFFGDKYNPEEVRMITIPDFSIELCGGTHVHATGEIGAFKITEMSALSAGHRRIVAVTGHAAIALFQQCFTTIKTLCTEFKVQRDELAITIIKQREHAKQLQHELKVAKKQLWLMHIPTWYAQHIMIDATPYLFLELDGYDFTTLRDIASHLAQKTGLYCIITNQDGKQLCIIALSCNLVDQLSLKKLHEWLKNIYQLSGGGNNTLLQSSGIITDVQKFNNAIAAWIKKH